jgi:hypothetical protein
MALLHGLLGEFPLQLAIFMFDDTSDTNATNATNDTSDTNQMMKARIP